MDLYQLPLSPNARRVRMVAAELGTKLDIKTLDFMKREHKLPDYLGKNPMGKVPTLVDGDFVLWESAAICTYLAHKAGKMVPKDARAIADHARWLLWNASHFEPPVLTVGFERVLKPAFGGETDQARVEGAMKDIAKYAPVLDAQLATHLFVTGAEPMIPDFALASSMEFGATAQIDWGAYPHIAAWFTRLKDRPSWKA